MKTSRIPGFYRLSPIQRLKIVQEFSGLREEEIELIKSTGSLKLEMADRMIENVIGTIPIPLGIATNFLINDKNYLIPMAIEEPSVVAAASNAAKIAREQGGFTTNSTDSIMIGQIQIINVEDPYGAKIAILNSKDEIIEKANEKDPILISFGGGARDLEVKVLDTFVGSMVIVELLVDCKDAMGANTVNTMVEAVSPIIENITHGKVRLRIISNLATKRLARAKAIFSKEALGGEEIVQGIIEAYAFARADPFRCATHNKGIMNGVIAVVLATGNDHRAVEAGAHAYAVRSGHYDSLTTWEKNRDNDLVGTIEMPMAVGIVGGATKVHPISKLAIKILKVQTAKELAEVIVAVGLAQNFAALRALADEGIQKGHMKLHARMLAATAGAKGEQIDIISDKMVQEGKISMDKAIELLKLAS
jgi:hydroxymethylglutaryl-CoA reductase